MIPRGTVQSVMTSASAFASSARQLCAELPALWAFAALLAELAPRLQHCAAPHLQSLMDLPNVKKVTIHCTEAVRNPKTKTMQSRPQNVTEKRSVDLKLLKRCNIRGLRENKERLERPKLIRCHKISGSKDHNVSNSRFYSFI